MDNSHQLKTTSGMGSLQWPVFSPGLLLEDEDLNAGVNYTRNLTRLMFKALFGCGVICGLKVTARLICKGTKLEITVGKGIALDCDGDPLEVPTEQTITYDPECEDFPPVIWVTVCYIEKCCRNKDVSCSADEDGQPKPTRVRAGFVIKLYDALPKCACRCGGDDVPPPAPSQDGCCDDDQPPPANQPVAGAPQQTDDPCPCYSAHFKGECECDCCCNCVLIAQILPLGQPQRDANGQAVAVANPQPAVNFDMVRRVRPVLNGYVDCRWPQKPGGGDPVKLADKKKDPQKPQV